jgi:membrane protease YdiL (CAAX protease family)
MSNPVPVKNMNAELGQPSRFSWRLFWILFVAAVLSALAVLPMAFELLGSALDQAQMPAVPLPLLILIGAIQNLALLGLIVGLGLRLSSKLGLGPQLTKAWLAGSLTQVDVWSAVRSGLLTGLGVSAILLPAILLLATRLPNLPFVIAARVPVWKRFLVCFYGGVYEEILARLFLLSLFAWLFNRSWRRPGHPGSGAFWAANVIVAVLFGLGHLPSASLVMSITPLVVGAALLLNGIAALAFGWLYRKYNLEAAIIAHFTADFVLYVVGPYFLMR